HRHPKQPRLRRRKPGHCALDALRAMHQHLGHRPRPCHRRPRPIDLLQLARRLGQRAPLLPLVDRLRLGGGHAALYLGYTHRRCRIGSAIAAPIPRTCASSTARSSSACAPPPKRSSGSSAGVTLSPPPSPSLATTTSSRPASAWPCSAPSAPPSSI